MSVEAAPVQEVFSGMPVPLYAASPSRLLSFLDCPRRFRFQYLDRPRPVPRPQRAHTSIGIATHNALRDWWDLSPTDRTPAGGVALLRKAWIGTGFRDEAQSGRWLDRVSDELRTYLGGVDPGGEPRGIERVVSIKTAALRLTGRVDRIDERAAPTAPGEPGRTELVVVDYKTSRRECDAQEARTSLPLALYAAAAWKVFRRRCVRVELHHVPSGTVASHTHTPESLQRKLAEADSIAREIQDAEASFAVDGAASTAFPALTSALCTWCDYRAACPEGQRMGPEKSSWAALERDDERRRDGEEVHQSG